MKLFTTTLALALLLSSSSLTAGVPNTVNYQGRITDPTGSPIADGAQLVKFQIYDAASGGTVLWNSLFQSVTTADGVFSYDLGSNVTLPNLFGNDTVRYLGITVGTDPEITPRTRFTSAGYVFEAQKSDLAMDADSLGGQHPSYYLDWGNMTSIPAGFADGVDDAGIDQATADGRYVLETGDTMTGNLSFNDNAGNTRVLVQRNFSEIDAFYPNGRNSFGGLIARAETGGWLLLTDTLGNRNIQLMGKGNGDGSVVIPDNAINSREMLDEPGIAANRNTTGVQLTKVASNPNQVLNVTISIPSAGYIVVEGIASTWFQNSATRITGWLRINQTAGGVWNDFSVWASFLKSGTSANYATIPVRRTYYKSTGGTYTFRMEGAQASGDSGSEINVFSSWLQATFYPTSYGSVITLASQPGDNPTAKAVSMTGPDGTLTTGYTMDLRYYEEKARAATIAAQKAELEKLQAQSDLAKARLGVGINEK